MEELISRRVGKDEGPIARHSSRHRGRSACGGPLSLPSTLRRAVMGPHRGVGIRCRDELGSAGSRPQRECFSGGHRGSTRRPPDSRRTSGARSGRHEVAPRQSREAVCRHPCPIDSSRMNSAQVRLCRAPAAWQANGGPCAAQDEPRKFSSGRRVWEDGDREARRVRAARPMVQSGDVLRQRCPGLPMQSR